MLHLKSYTYNLCLSNIVGGLTMLTIIIFLKWIPSQSELKTICSPCPSMDLDKLYSKLNSILHDSLEQFLEKREKPFIEKEKNINKIDQFKSVALSLNPVTDKVSYHKYEIMYGIFLSEMQHYPIKMLEIGLGCNMNYGPGASVNLWKKYLHSSSEIWMADVDTACVEKYTNHESLRGIKIITGDQENIKTLDSWIETTGGGFDVIIDDGGHSNNQILQSFLKLWPVIKPGGIYFIEDLSSGRHWPQLTGNKLMVNIIQEWIGAISNDPIGENRPDGIHFVFCQWEACAIGKAP